jgi:hypothetical protein
MELHPCGAFGVAPQRKLPVVLPVEVRTAPVPPVRVIVTFPDATVVGKMSLSLNVAVQFVAPTPPLLLTIVLGAQTTPTPTVAGRTVTVWRTSGVAGGNTLAG